MTIYPFVPEQIAAKMLEGPAYNRGEWQSDGSSLKTYEFWNCILELSPGMDLKMLQNYIRPDLPWAEDHFQERISGQPLNPPPSAERWPWHQAAKDLHTDELKSYSHTYPERFWPKFANHKQIDDPEMFPPHAHMGIRYPYGDLADLIRVLKDRPFTRQAYLPIFFPEDTGAPVGQRIPCTLGYHFIRNGQKLDCNYFIRSCDMTRHLRNDMYMAARLLQYVNSQVKSDYGLPYIGKVTMFISNLHIFEEDAWRWRK